MNQIKHVLMSGLVVSVVMLLGVSGSVYADTGVSDSRVSLPEGPGSLEGVGENVEIDPNMGNMQYKVAIEVPAGFAKVTPKLSLNYSSSNGSSLVGMGWSFSVPKIERSKSRRLPNYTEEDFFVADGGNELVYVAGAQATDLPCAGGRVYRARFEKDYTRYTWCNSGGDDYWVSESGGTLAFFGANKDTSAVTTARVGKSATEIFRYHLVDTVDIFGHHMRHKYHKDSGLPTDVAYLKTIEYNFRPVSDDSVEGDVARHRIELGYETRADAIANCQGGYEEMMTKRLEDIEIFVDQTKIRSYKLTYEDDSLRAPSGGFTRLQKVEKFGRDNTLYPGVFSFEYQDSSRDASTSMVTAGPFDFPTVSGFSTGRMTLNDMNGDALPDILDTRLGTHTLYKNELSGDTVMAQEFQVGEVILSGEPDYDLSVKATKMLDFNGDGFTDIVYFKNVGEATFYANRGTGRWEPTMVTKDSAAGAYPAGLISDGSCKFLDADSDKRIDCVHITDTTLVWYHNTTSGWVKEAEKAWDCVGWNTNAEPFDFADVNGDGMLDVTMWDSGLGTLKYKLNLGHGDFKPGCDARIEYETEENSLQKKIEASSSSDDMNGAVAENRLLLEDINNDGLNDVVYVEKSSGFDDPGTMHYWLNRNSVKFLDPYTITGLPSTKLSGGEEDGDKVLFADMNGNGSTDVVIFSHDRKMEYVDLFPKRPHLISRIENGLGQVTRVTFEPSVNFHARDLHDGNLPWPNALPFPQQVVSKLEVWEKVAPSFIDETIYRYHDGYYDGDEKQFRGYERVEQINNGDAYEAPGRVVSFFDVGAPDATRLSYRPNNHAPYWNGKLLWQETYGGVDLNGDGEITSGELGPDQLGLLVKKTVTEYQECTVSLAATDGARGCTPVGAIGSMSLSDTDLDADTVKEAVIHIQPVATTTTIQEGLLEAEWKVVRSQSSYDGFGNLVYDEKFGAGSTTDGDETFTFSRFIPLSGTNNRWMPNLLAESYKAGEALASGAEGALPAVASLPSLYTHSRTYYDGKVLMESDSGLVTSKTSRMDKSVSNTGVIVADERFITDVTNAYDTHGNIVFTQDAVGNARGYHYDADFLRPTNAFLESGTNSFLCRTTELDAIWAKPIKGSIWVAGQGALSATGVAGLSCPISDSTPSTQYKYDEYARVIAKASPGDTLASPTEEYEYKLGLNAQGVSDPANAVRSETISRKRTKAGGAFDLEVIRCDDGRGRTYQTLSKIKDDTGADKDYQADGFKVFNKKGKEVKTYQPYHRPLSKHCDSTEPSHAHTITRYDGSDRVIKVTHPDGTFINTTFGPLVSRVWDENRHKTTQWSDGADRVVAVQRPLLAAHSEATRYMELHYDSLSRLLGYRDAGGNQKTQAYDLQGRILEVQDPNAGRLWYQYDDVGSITRRGDARGVVIVSEYDPLKRKASEWDSADKVGTERRWYFDASQEGCLVNGEDKCTYPAGHPVKTTFAASRCPDNGVCSAWFGQSARGLGVYHGATLPEANGFRFESASSYDNANRLTRSTYPDGRSLDFTYDGAGRFVAMDLGDQKLVEVKYNDENLVRSRLYANGVEDIFTYDQRLRAKTRITQGASEKYQANTYSRDPAGNILGVQDDSVFEDLWSGTYKYDAWNRLTTASEGKSPTEVPYQYDDIDNIKAIGNQTHSYDNARPNALVSAGPISYQYDASGNTTKRGSTSFVWDGWGRLVQAKDGESVSGEFVYGMDQLRVLKVEQGHDGWNHTLSKSFEVRNGVAVITPRLNRDRIAIAENPGFMAKLYADQNADDVIRVNDAWLVGGADPRTRRSFLAASAERLLSSTEPWFLHHDHLGSVTVASDITGAVVGRTGYTPLGTQKDTEGYLGAYGFTGQEQDASTELLHFEFRYLDATIGRWASADPAFYKSTTGNFMKYGEATTAYAYVANRAVNANDPKGLFLKKGGGGKVSNQAAARASTSVSGAKASVTAKTKARGDTGAGRHTIFGPISSSTPTRLEAGREMSARASGAKTYVMSGQTRGQAEFGGKASSGRTNTLSTSSEHSSVGSGNSRAASGKPKRFIKPGQGRNMAALRQKSQSKTKLQITMNKPKTTRQGRLDSQMRPSSADRMARSSGYGK
jgi:RHS repeat-associated protein